MSPPDLFCSSCGERNVSEAVFCSSCGARLAKPAPPPVETVPPAPPRSSGAIPLTSPARLASARGNPLPLLLALGAIAVLLVVVLVEAVVIVLPRGTVSQAGGATLSLLQGQVELQKRGQGDWIEAAQDLGVEAGDRIRTGEASYGVLSFMEGTTTQLSALTELTIRDLQVDPGTKVVIRLDLDLGEIWNQIAELPADSLHEVTTAAATVTCRGSEYGIVVNEMGTTWVRGQDGRVEVTGGGSTVPVAPGDTLMVELGQAPVSYGAVAMVPTAPVQEVTVEVTSSIQGADMPTFLNQPLATASPTNTPPPTSTPRPVPPSPTPTATMRPQPTATPRSIDCPTITILTPSRAPANRPFGIEFDRNPAKPGGYEYVVEFRQPNGQWNRAEPVPANVSKRGQYWMAELRAPGEGEWHWRICLVRANDLRGEAVCCSAEHVITVAIDEPCDT